MQTFPRRAATLAAAVLLALPLVPAFAGTASSVAPAPCLLSGDYDCPLVTPGNYVTEPTVHQAPNGDIIVCGPNGVPSQSALWRLDAERRFQPMDAVPTAPAGGGDCDFQFDSTGRLCMIDLWLVGNSIACSDDHQHWASSSPLTFKVPVGDRQWIDSAGNGVVYIAWRNLADGIWVAKSTDGGITFLPEILVSATATKGGNIVIDRTDPTLNTVYFAWAVDRVYQNNAGVATHVLDEVHLSKTTDGGLTWTDELVRSATTNVAQQFPVIALDTVGNRYMTWVETDTNGAIAIFAATSAKGSTAWSAPIRVNQDAATTNTFPWIIAGDAGRFAVAWYGADYVGTPDDHGHDWFLHVATTFDDGATWNDQKIEQIKYAHWICTKGTLCVVDGLDSPGRELGDFLTIDKDSRGAIFVSYDGQQSFGGAYTTRFVRQACGEGLYASVGLLQGDGACAPLPVPPPATTVPLAGTYYAHGTAPVNNVDGLVTIVTPVTSLSQTPPTSVTPKVASNGANQGGSNAGTIYDAHWFLGAPSAGFALDGTVAAHLYVTAASTNAVATIAIYDANAGSFADIAAPIAKTQVSLPTGGPTEITVTFPGLSTTLHNGFELFMSVTGTGDSQVLYDSTSTPTRVDFN